jgi:hypothetical protein
MSVTVIENVVRNVRMGRNDSVIFQLGNYVTELSYVI